MIGIDNILDEIEDVKEVEGAKIAEKQRVDPMEVVKVKNKYFKDGKELTVKKTKKDKYIHKTIYLTTEQNEILEATIEQYKQIDTKRFGNKHAISRTLEELFRAENLTKNDIVKYNMNKIASNLKNGITNTDNPKIDKPLGLKVSKESIDYANNIALYNNISEYFRDVIFYMIEKLNNNK